jgi:L-amino acid N-acyltransferase
MDARGGAKSALANYAHPNTIMRMIMQDQVSENRADGSVSIRPATAADLAAIAEIYTDAILNTTATFDTKAKTADDLRAWFEGHDARHPFLVADAGDAGVVAWAALHPWSDRCAYADTAEISVYVHPQHRGRGAGRTIVGALIAAGRDAKLHTVLARISAGNAASLRLHESYGFKMVGTMKEVGRKFGRFIDVHVMQLVL